MLAPGDPGRVVLSVNPAAEAHQSWFRRNDGSRRSRRRVPPRGLRAAFAAVLSLPVGRVGRTAEHPAAFEGNTWQVLDSPIVQEINYPTSEACYAAEIAAILQLRLPSVADPVGIKWIRPT